MSRENVDMFKRVSEALNRRDVEAALADIDAEVEWHPALFASVAGDAATYWGHEGVREWVRDVDEAFDETHGEFSEIRDLGDRLVAIGQLRTRGKASGVATESPLCYVVDVRDGRVARVRTYLDPKKALEAVGLEE